MTLACHVTPCHLLPEIFRSGALLSYSERKRLGMREDDAHYWGSEGKKDELQDYVCCSFQPAWGMINPHDEELAILVLEPEVCALPGTCFCPSNSAYSAFPSSDIMRRTGCGSFDDCFQ